MDWEKSVYWTGMAAKAGDSTAQMNLGEAYELGTSVAIDLELAAYWYRQSADNGFEFAKERLEYLRGTPEQWYELGKAYYNRGADYYNHAVYWYEKSARKGNTDAMLRLAYMYAYALGLKKDYAEAVRWEREAADENNRVAQYNLGVFYENGWGVRQSLHKARLWYEKSARQGYEDASKALEKLGK
jgi:hypothetical protein